MKYASYNMEEGAAKVGARSRVKFGLAGIAAVGALAVGLAGTGVVTLPQTGVASAAESAAITASASDIALSEQVAEKCLPSVGSVYCLIDQDGMSGIAQGSCEVIDASGILLTNYHVVDGASKIEVAIAGETFEAELVGSDPTSDVAVLRIDPGETELVALEIGSSADLKVGQWVMTIGSPMGESESVSQGIVSGLNRTSTYDLSDDVEMYYVGLIQSDAMINEGSSGGAMVNANGELVGITTMIASTTGDFAGMTYAIPVDYAMNIAGQILQDGVVAHPLFGASVISISNAYYSGYYEPGDEDSLLGAYVYSVVEGMGADAAGVEPGDIVIAVDDMDVYSPEDLVLAVRSHAIGEEVTVTVLRDGEELEFTVTLSSDQDEAVSSRSVEKDAGEQSDGQEEEGFGYNDPHSFFGDQGYGEYGYADPGQGYGYYSYGDPGQGNYGYYGYYANPGYGYGYPGQGYGYYNYGYPGQGYGYYNYAYPGQGYGQYDYYGYGNQQGGQDSGNGVWDFLGQIGNALGFGF